MGSAWFLFTYLDYVIYLAQSISFSAHDQITKLGTWMGHKFTPCYMVAWLLLVAWLDYLLIYKLLHLLGLALNTFFILTTCPDFGCCSQLDYGNLELFLKCLNIGKLSNFFDLLERITFMRIDFKKKTF